MQRLHKIPLSVAHREIVHQVIEDITELASRTGLVLGFCIGLATGSLLAAMIVMMVEA